MHALDNALFEAWRAVDPARLLNPLNVPEAQAAFFAGASAPPFRYAASTELLEWAERLGRLPVPRSHAFGGLLAEAVRSFVAMAEALRYRDAESFERWADLEGWETAPGPEPHSAQAHGAQATPGREAHSAETEPAPEPAVSASTMRRALEAALAERELAGWVVRADSVMSARILVESSRREIRVNPRAVFKASDVGRLIAHEIDVHVTRAANGAGQSLLLFELGLPGSLQTEEGLAVTAETLVGGPRPGSSHHQARVQGAIGRARVMGFRELWESLQPGYSAKAAFTVSLRLKRGLAVPGAPGVYAKDAVYGVGRQRVERWLDAGGRIEHLYIGKVGVHHPVGEWLEAGLVTPGPVPGMWPTGTSLNRLTADEFVRA